MPGHPSLLRVEPPSTEVLSYLDGLSGTDVGRAARALATVCEAYGPLDRSELVHLL